jgi:2-dehydropantoate 2-reductase
MKVCIVGLGAIGGLFAGWLGGHAKSGDVQLAALARGDTLTAVQQHGLRIESAGVASTVPLRAAADPAALGTQDLVIVAVKGPALASVAPAVRALCDEQTQVLVAMNGVPWWFFDGLPGPCAGLRLRSVDPDGQLHALLPTAQVIGGVVHASCQVPAPGRVRHVQGAGLVLGRPAGGTDTHLQAVAALLAQAGFAVTVSDRIQREVWFKLWGNMTMNPISALTGATADRVLDDPLVRAFISGVMLEMKAVGAAFGIPIEQSPEDRHAVTRKLGAFKTSMLQDLEAGRPLEVNALLEAPQEIARKLGVSTPHLDALVGLTRLLGASVAGTAAAAIRS